MSPVVEKLQTLQHGMRTHQDLYHALQGVIGEKPRKFNTRQSHEKLVEVDTAKTVALMTRYVVKTGVKDRIYWLRGLDSAEHSAYEKITQVEERVASMQ